MLADEHRRLLTSIIDGPTSAALTAMREHLQQAEDALVALV
jgi:DNA-binding GntR family transcriptional regulator